MSSAEVSFSSSKRQSSMGPATVLVQKRPAGSTRMSYGGPGSHVISRQTVSRNYAGRPGGTLTLKHGTAAHASKESVGAVMANREKEKGEMCGLNDRFANYIEKVRFLEAQNKIMMQELEKLRKMKGYTQDAVKELYEQELQEARDTIKELSKKNTPLESKIVALQDETDTRDLEIEDLRKQRDELMGKVDQLNQFCGDLEGEVALHRKSVESLQQENNRLRGDVENLRNDNLRIRDDCEDAVTAQLDATNKAQMLEEELDFLKTATDAEIQELRELLQQHKSTLPMMQQTWAGEFKTALNLMKEEYDDQIENMSREQRCSYDDQLMRIKANINKDETDSAMVKSEVKTLKSQLNDKKNKHGDLESENDRLRLKLRDLQDELARECEECEEEKKQLRNKNADLTDEMEECMTDMEALKDKKLSLELEIRTYRKLLEGEEKSLQKMVQDQGKVQSKGAADLASVIAGSQSQKSTMSESTGMVRVTRSSKCAVSIAETAQDGTYIKLENTSTTKDFDLHNYKLERSHPKGKCTYKFENFKLPKGKSIKIYGFSFEDGMDKGSLVGDKSCCKTWGHGNGNVTLCDDKDAEKATSSIIYN